MTEDKAPETLEATAQQAQSQHYVLVLYVAGMTVNSQEAIQNVTRICREKLAGRYSLQIIDIYQQPELAEDANIVAAPTLLKALPHPLRRIIGNLAQTDKVLVGLGLTTVADDGGPSEP
jgi:circadian clock protein KaiB